MAICKKSAQSDFPAAPFLLDKLAELRAEIHRRKLRGSRQFVGNSQKSAQSDCPTAPFLLDKLAELSAEIHRKNRAVLDELFPIRK
ncbi:MAG: hypothetical protein ACI4JZ_05935 [Oscillospiraceae bacterium]